MSFQFDHRQLADEMEIYFLNEEIGAGLPVWLPNGVAIRDELENFVRGLERKAGYQRVVSPHIGRASLYEKSGHLEHYSEDMFPPFDGSYLKPMNCPHHHLVFSQAPRSFRQLPLRIAEYGQVYRNENSGSLRGLSRARCLCQNDAHIYLAPEQALDEIKRVLDLHEECYLALGLRGYRYRLSKGAWPESEEILRRALRDRGLDFFEAENEAAFYGPKIDVQMKLAHGHEESVASVQLDLFSAERFDLSYIDSSGVARRPWIIHRAPMGSHERFVSLLLEYYDGQLPMWLAPVQLYLLPLPGAEDAALELARALDPLRVRVDGNQGSLSKRILFAHRLRPFAKIVLGPREIREGRVKLQFRNGEREVALKDIAAEVATHPQEKDLR